MLYPIQFKPRVRKFVWGGESWEISGVPGDVSVVANGFLKGNSLQEAIEVYMGDLVGDKVFQRFGEEFPLLVKYIDARDKLSVQVHPGDALAAARHGAYGKTEMWYILSCEPDAELMVGFKEGVTREVYEVAVADGTVGELLNRVPVKPGDAYFIPAGTVHSIEGGIRLVEIQQTSDITYRVFDWNRAGADGHPRELHTGLAVDAIDFAAPVRRITQAPPKGEAALLVESSWFTVNLVDIAGRTERELASRDSFTVYICTSGEVTLTTPGGSMALAKGGVVLIPAECDSVVFEGSGQIIETYI